MKYIFANFKLNPIPTHTLYPSIYKSSEAVTVVVFPPAVFIHKCIADGLAVGAQCGSSNTFGAFTGEVNMPLIKDSGCTYVLCGHSERRTLHHETNEDVALQVTAAVQAGLTPVICIGETLAERESGTTESVLQTQLNALEFNNDCIIAYEPVWAIGTGVTATTEQIHAVHAFLRQILATKNCNAVPLLYGGSVNANNAKEIVAIDGVDGALVGGASLKEDFAQIVAAC